MLVHSWCSCPRVWRATAVQRSGRRASEQETPPKKTPTGDNHGVLENIRYFNHQSVRSVGVKTVWILSQCFTDLCPPGLRLMRRRIVTWIPWRCSTPWMSWWRRTASSLLTEETLSEVLLTSWDLGGRCAGWTQVWMKRTLSCDLVSLIWTQSFQLFILNVYRCLWNSWSRRRICPRGKTVPSWLWGIVIKYS